jgi:hypothetical protein
MLPTSNPQALETTTMLKQFAYWLGFIFMRHRGWSIETLRTAQKFYLSKNEDIRSFHLESDWTRKELYNRAIKIIDSWEKL